MKNNKHMKPFFNAVSNNNVLELMVYDAIGASCDGITALDVKAQLDANEYDSILMRINSPGGDPFEGVAIHNLLRAQGKPVNVVVDGIAASAASIIAMAGDQIQMNSNSLLMIHNAWCLQIGNAADFRKQADVLDTIDKAIAQTFVDRTGQPLETVSAMMSAETWMSATDALKNGFCSAIGNSDNKAAMNLAKTFKAMANMKNLPAVLKNESEEPEETETETECTCDCENCTVALALTLIALLRIAKDAPCKIPR
jgi:ATP-dependent protease ClpP protease subunit